MGPKKGFSCKKQSPNDDSEKTDDNNQRSDTQSLVLEQPNTFIPLDKLSPAEAAFTIEKIRKLIFSYSCPKDLLQFRLVSWAWCHDATNKTLLSCLGNTIQIGSYASEEMWKEEERTYCESDLLVYARSLNWNKELKRPLQELIDVMDGNGSNFPCSQFRMSYNHAFEGEEQLQTFLTLHGARIKKLELTLFYRGYCTDERDDFGNCNHGILWLNEFVKKLLLEQAPNIVKLCIFFKQCQEDLGIACKMLGNSRRRVNPPSAFNLKLESAKFYQCNRQSVFQSLCQIAPNLKDMERFDIEFYLEPENRIYLLKKLMYSPGGYPQNELDLRRIANTNGKLQLKKLCYSVVYNDRNKRRTANNLSKILEKSSHSLEKLNLEPLESLPGIKIPVMPKVKYILFYSDSDDADEGKTFFPRGIRLSETFPNLECITLHPNTEENISQSGNFLIGSDNEIVPSVKRILRYANANPVNLQKYQQWFPNAVIEEISKDE